MNLQLPTARPMTEITQLLRAVDSGDQKAAEELLPIVYQELRRLAKVRLSHEQPGQTLQATDLVHEAYRRLVDGGEDANAQWNSTGHFFGAAAEAMRRILIDRARAKAAKKRGGDRQRVEFEELEHPAAKRPERFLLLDEALTKLETQDPLKAQLVKLRFFAGLTNKQAAAALGISTATADRAWAFARAWIKSEMDE
jgi:RNA polymerase sigma factor (TIGR02999 family)